jgi:hypothetical protein
LFSADVSKSIWLSPRNGVIFEFIVARFVELMLVHLTHAVNMLLEHGQFLPGATKKVASPKMTSESSGLSMMRN